MGAYRLISYSKKMSYQGFMYYEYKLFRVKKFILQAKSKSKVTFEDTSLKMETVSDPVPDIKVAAVVATEVSCFPSC